MRAWSDTYAESFLWSGFLYHNSIYSRFEARFHYYLTYRITVNGNVGFTKINSLPLYDKKYISFGFA